MWLSADRPLQGSNLDQKQYIEIRPWHCNYKLKLVTITIQYCKRRCTCTVTYNIMSPIRLTPFWITCRLFAILFVVIDTRRLDSPFPLW